MRTLRPRRWTAFLRWTGAAGPGPRPGAPRGVTLPQSSAPSLRPDATEAISGLLRERILLLDGAMGTLIQGFEPGEADYRGERFADWGRDVKGNSDLLNLTQPEMIRSIHRQYLAGRRRHRRDQHLHRDLDRAGRLRHGGPRLRDQPRRRPARPRGVRRGRDRGPPPLRGRLARARPTAPRRSPRTSTTRAPATSPSRSWSRPTSSRRAASSTAAPTCSSSRRSSTPSTPRPRSSRSRPLFEEHGRRWPVIMSGTITDASGRTLSGQVTEAFWNSVRHVRPLAVGLNCALGAADMRPYVAELARLADTFVSSHPNAGLPNAFGEYDESPEQMAATLGEFAASGLVNIVGGCCGTTPAHIEAIAEAADGAAPRIPGRAPARHAPGRARAAHDHRRQPVRQRRRAHQHHRLGEVPQPDQGRRLRHRPDGRRPAGRERRPGHRRQHGRGHDRRRRRDGPLPQAGRQRARHQPGAR